MLGNFRIVQSRLLELHGVVSRERAVFEVPRKVNNEQRFVFRFGQLERFVVVSDEVDFGFALNDLRLTVFGCCNRLTTKCQKNER